MNDIKIKVKKDEVVYCFKADNYEEFHRRFNQLANIMYQRFIDELTKEQLKKSMINSIYGVSCRDNKRFGMAKRGNSR